MEMYHCGERIYVLPENAVCKADEYKRNPLDIDNCPLGHEVCTGAVYDEEFEFTDDMTDDEISDEINDWAEQFLETWWEEAED